MQTVNKKFPPFKLLPPTRTTTTSNEQEPEDSSSILASASPSATNSSLSLPTHHLPNGAYRNPWPSANSNQSHLVHFINSRIPLQLAKKFVTHLKPVRTLPADLKLYSNPPYPNPLSNHPPPLNQLVSTWLGHAGYLVQFPIFRTSSNSRPFRVLFDPMFSIRAGPTQWTGPKRLKPSPCHIKQIPMVDICLISHSHYDHLDFDTIKALAKRQPHLKYFVPLGLKAWFDSVSVPSNQVVELDWWQSCGPDGPVGTSQNFSIIERINCNESEGTSIRITCVPAQHSSGRSLLDQNMTLWCGWIIEQMELNLDVSYQFQVPTPRPSGSLRSSPDLSSSDQSPSNTTKDQDKFSNCSDLDVHRQAGKRCCIYFAGDTGYRSPHDRDLICPAFKEIGEKFGPIDFSMIPIWRGGSLSFVSWAGFRISDPSFLVAQHATPEDAIRIHLDVKSKHSVGIHHSCFIGNDQESLEALVELSRFKKIYKVDDFYKPNGFGVVDVGETIELDILNLTSSASAPNI